MRKSAVSLASAIILRAISDGHRYGFEIMQVTGLASGTIYPALRRLEESGLIESHHEEYGESFVPEGPPRKHFRVTAVGKKALEAARERYPLIGARQD